MPCIALRNNTESVIDKRLRYRTVSLSVVDHRAGVVVLLSGRGVLDRGEVATPPAPLGGVAVDRPRRNTHNPC